MDRAEKNSESCSDDWHLWSFWSAFRHFRTHFAESFRMSKSSWMMDPNRSRKMPSCSAIDLAEIRRSSKISSWIWSIISGVITVLGGPGRGATQVGKITTFKLGHPIFDGIRWCMFPYYFCQNGGNFLRRLALQGKKNLMTAHVSMLLKSRASPDMLPFSICNKKRLAFRHMNRSLFPTTLSIPSYDIGKYVGQRTYQHPLVHEDRCTFLSISRSFLLIMRNVWDETCRGNQNTHFIFNIFISETLQFTR